MSNTLLAVFGFLAVVAVGSAVYFRRRSLGTSSRIALSVLAVGLLALRFVRDHELTAEHLALVVAAAVILGSGVWFLWREQAENQPRE